MTAEALRVINTIIGVLAVSLIPILLILFFSKEDEEYSEKIKLTKRNAIIIIVLAAGYGLITPITITEQFQYINLTILIAYLVFMSYTDQKIMLLYSSASIVMIIFEGIALALNFNNIVFNKYTPTILIVLLILNIMSIFKWIGYGDVLIYTVISLYYLQYRAVPTMSLMLNILFTNIMFVVVTLIIRIVKKDKSRHQPLTIYIAISTYLCNIKFVKKKLNL